MYNRLLSAALFLSASLVALQTARAQSLPPLIATNFGSFGVRSQTSLVNNNPGENSSYSLVGGGNELWGDADKGLFGFFPTTGDFDVRVRVESLENVHRYAKTGLMVRESLSSVSRMVSLFATPTGPTELPADNPVGEDQVEFNFRRASREGKNNINLGSPGYPNAWLRLARRGNIVYGLVSRDGTNWTRSASVDTSTWPGTPLKPNVLLGLGSSSHEDDRLVRSELRDFSNVTTVGPVNILTQPVSSYGLDESTVTLSVAVNDPVDAKFQWFANGTVIPGATNATYTTATLDPSTDQAKYKVSVTGRNGTTVTSADATLSVVSIDPPEFPDAYFDFDDGEVPIFTSVYGTAEIDPSAGAGGSGGMVLARAANNQNGAFIVSDVSPGEVVNGFTAAFKLKIGPGTARPSDGFSFSFGPSIPDGLLASPQQGAGPGLAVSFDIYDNQEFEAPAIDIFYGVDPSITPLNYRGNILHHPVPVEELVNSRYVDVIIRMNPGGKLDVVYDGQVIAYQVQTPFVPVAGGKFAFAAYAGGQNAFHGIDDVRIDNIISNNEAYLASISPLGNNVSATPEIRVELVDLSTEVVHDSIELYLNGAKIAPVIGRDENTLATIVTYAVPTRLGPLSTNTVSVVWSDNAGKKQTNNATFKVGEYTTLSAASATAVGSGVDEDSGFKVRVYQIPTELTPSELFAEAVLEGGEGDNLADLTIADETGVFVEPSITGTIDYDANSAPIGLSTFPGIPGLSDSKENFVAEITALIEFPSAGFYQMGVRSDDGFVVTSEGEVLGAFHGEREPADSIFGFVVPQAGVYPFRLLYYQATGGAKVRWFSVTPSGQQILINQPENENALRAFRTREGGTTVAPRITVTHSGSALTLNWSGGGTLESSTDLRGNGWSAVPNATNPYTTSTASGRMFFRIRQ